MAIVTNMKRSDLSGQIAEDTEFVSVVVRQHPKTDQPKTLDILATEAEQFKGISDLVVLEVTTPGGSKEEVSMRLADFNKLGSNMDEVVKNARGTRGRVPGTKVGNGNGS